MTIEPPLYAEVLEFWRAAGPSKWFAKEDGFDAEIRGRFEPLHFAAARGELAGWAETAEGALALLLTVDQFPRTLFRGSAHAFATDPMARTVAEAAIDRGFDRAVEPALRPFFYLPFEHSERLEDQERSVALCEALLRDTGDADTLKWALLHRDLIARFGRFPHRNAAFGRESTPAEADYMANGGFEG
jgi:uncharacterized protein (DUF924 family)